MKATFGTTRTGTWAYIQKSVRIDGRSTTKTVKRLGLLEDIRKTYGCEDPRQWVIDLAARMTEEEKMGKERISVDFYPGTTVSKRESPLRMGGDLFLLPLYNKLGLPEICSAIVKSTKVQYDLNEILKTLVVGRLLFPSSKSKTRELAQNLVRPSKFAEEDMYRALSLLSGHIADIQAQVYVNSSGIMERRDRVIYYDCTNYYFEIEDNDKDIIDRQTGEFIAGMRKRGKSKENRPNPIVQMGMFMDMDGIPLAFVVFPGNESEQTTLKPLEEILDRKFGLTDFIVSTDAGLGSEANRRYNMAEGRDYICVQSLPSLKAEDRDAAIDPHGWRLAYSNDDAQAAMLTDRYSQEGVFNLAELLDDKDKAAVMLRGTTFYKEILVDKAFKYENPDWIKARKESPDKTPTDAAGKCIPRHLKSVRQERIIVTYSHDFALYLKHKRAERLSIAKKIVAKGQTNTRRSQQSPLNYIETIYKTDDGETSVKTELVIKDEVLQQEEVLDGFYAYATSLDDEAIQVLKARSFHHEIEHLFRTTKTHLDARPVYLTRQDRIRSHFLVCFLALTILKLLQRQITQAFPEVYKDTPLSIDLLIETLQKLRFGQIQGAGYIPMFTRTTLTDHLQEIVGVEVNKQIITKSTMNAFYRKVNKS